MEASPLVKAHAHAREASVATHTADTAAAVTEHALAAGEFATAARDTASVEALRTLRLLEQHHQRLSQLLKASLARKGHEDTSHDQQQHEQQHEQQNDPDEKINEKGIDNDKPAPLGTATTTTSVSGVVTRGEFAGGGLPADGSASSAAATLGNDGSPLQALRNVAVAGNSPLTAAADTVVSMTGQQQQQQPQQPPQKQPHRRYPPARELSSSIANNLASARGIRGNGSPGPVAGATTATTVTSASTRHNQRGQPAAPSVSNDLAPGSLEGAPGRGSRARMQNVLQQQQQQQQQQQHSSNKPSWLPPTPAPSRQQQQHPQMYVGTDADDDDDAAAAGVTKADDGFSRFYNRFGSIINRLSAPLAFAGLPLVAEEPSPVSTAASAAAAEPQKQSQNPQNPQTSHKPSHKQKQQQQQHQRQRQRASSQLSSIAASAYSYYNNGFGGSGGGSGSTNPAEPDLSQIYSHAALRAIGAVGGGSNNPNDSFYVVPKTGHTASYANILSFDQKEKRRMAASVHGEEVVAVRDDDHENQQEDDDQDDDFVDAKERRPRPPRNRINRMHNAQTSAPDHVLEELYTENQGLKDMLDKLSRRLHAFEASAQSSHMALQESMRFMPGGGVSGGGGISSSTATPDDKQLEAELARVSAQLSASERERAHQEKTLQKYRDKWEKLKAGAKARRDAQA